MKKSLMVLVAGGALAACLAWWGYSARHFGGLVLALCVVLACLAVAWPCWRGGLTALTSLLVGMALVEFGLGWLQRDAAATHFDPQSDYVQHYWAHTDIGALPRPGQHSTRKLTASGEVIYDARYTIGDDGFRVTPRPEVVPLRRVNVMGCSVAFGEGLNDDQTLAYQTQKRLPGTQFKSFAIHGYGMHQALAILESERDTRGQVNLLLTAPWHAERSACVPAFALGSPRYRLSDDGSVVRDGVCGGIGYYPLSRLVSLSRVYTLVKSVHAQRQGQDPQIDLYLGLVRRIVALSKARGQTALIAYMRAQENWFTGQYDNAKIMAALQAMGVEVVDVTLAPRVEEVDPSFHLHPLDEHPSAKANEASAALLVKPLGRVLHLPVEAR